MFTRIVECHAKSGKLDDCRKLLAKEALPILKKQPGFVDEVTLTSSTDPNRIMAISFWKTQEDAKRYNQEQYPQIVKMVEPLLTTSPKVDTYNVDLSTFHQISLAA